MSEQRFEYMMIVIVVIAMIVLVTWANVVGIERMN